jgi:hypothetical protein
MFGAHPFPVKEIIGALGVVLNGTNGPAREHAMNLMLEMNKWIGKAPFASLLENIRSAQKTEFEKLVAEQEEEVSRDMTVEGGGCSHNGCCRSAY